MEIRVYDTVEATAEASAHWMKERLCDAVQQRGVANLALSGGRTPWRMLESPAIAELPWNQLHVFQVDERAVPVDDERRNGRRITTLMVRPDRLAGDHFHPMHAENPDLEEAAAHYSRELKRMLGADGRLDVVQLGLGADAHTASLVPGDPLLRVVDRAVGVCGLYQGTQRLSLTFPALNAARYRQWLVTGADKTEALAALLAGDKRVPCGHVQREDSVIFADAAAAAGLRD
jgi:6-phosphogluconolactonase